MNVRGLRIASQIFFFMLSWMGIVIGMTGLIYPYFFCVACPYAFAACPIGMLEWAFIPVYNALIILLYLISFILLMGVIFGRAFCGWACPVGLIMDIMYRIRPFFFFLSPLYEKGLRIAEKMPSIPNPKYYKYMILILIPVTSFIGHKMAFTRIDPVGFIFASIPQTVIGGYRPTVWYWVKLFLFLLVMAGALSVRRSFCRFVCPLGALYAPMNKISMTRITVDENKCVRCMMCRKACPMGVNIPESKRSAECILCGRCVDACNFDAIHITFLDKRVI